MELALSVTQLDTMHITSLSLDALACYAVEPHLFNGLFFMTTWVSQYQKGKTSLDFNEAIDDGVWDAEASAGPYANNLHLAAVILPHQHLVTQFYRPDALPDTQPTVSKH